jgi:hypothetical protein
MAKGQTGFVGICVVALALGWATTAGAALTAAQKCEAAKDKASGNLAKCLENEFVKFVNGKTGSGIKCLTKFSDALAKAEQKASNAGGSCPTTDDLHTDIFDTLAFTFYDFPIGVPQALTGTRFIDYGNGTVTDTQTGLTWEQKTGTVGPAVDCSSTTCSDPHDVNNTYQWCKDADHDSVCDTAGNPPDGGTFTDFLDKLNNCTSTDGTTLSGGFAGQCDWRLPTLQELRGIVDSSVPGCITGSACIDPIFGPTDGGSGAFYWASTLDGNTPVNAWYVYFANGFAGGYRKYITFHVRAVRGQ